MARLVAHRVIRPVQHDAVTVDLTPAVADTFAQAGRNHWGLRANSRTRARGGQSDASQVCLGRSDTEIETRILSLGNALGARTGGRITLRNDRE
jgi:hypothetical protein